MSKQENTGKSEDGREPRRRVSLHVEEDLYIRYMTEVNRRKLTKEDTQASLNQLIQDAMRAYEF